MELDLHIHSKYSYDSFSNPKKIIKSAIKKGLDGIAITDHNTIKGSIEACEYEVDNFIVIPGIEMETEIGDIIGLFINEEINSKIAIEVIDEIKEQDGISILAHPYKRTDTIDENIINEIDAIEVFNARANTFKNSKGNLKAEEIANKYNLPITAGSDAHFYFEIGRGRVEIDPDDHNNLEEIKEEIMNKNAKIKGIESSPYIEIGSQFIKIIKRKQMPGFNKCRHFLDR